MRRRTLADGEALEVLSVLSAFVHILGPFTTINYRADKPGEYAYSCTFHPTMKATLTVQ